MDRGASGRRVGYAEVCGSALKCLRQRASRSASLNFDPTVAPPFSRPSISDRNEIVDRAAHPPRPSFDSDSEISPWRSSASKDLCCPSPTCSHPFLEANLPAAPPFEFVP